MPCEKRGLRRLEVWPSPSIVRIVVLLSIFADAQHELTDCRIEIVSPQIGDTFEAGSSVLLELGLIDCPVCYFVSPPSSQLERALPAHVQY